VTGQEERNAPPKPPPTPARERPQPVVETRRDRRGPAAWFRTWRDRGLAAWDRVQAARPRYRTLDTAFTVMDRDTKAAGSLLAGAIAYRLFLWLLPAALVAYAGLGFAAASDPSTAVDAAHAAGIRQLAEETITKAAEDAQRSRWVALLIGIVLLYMASSHLLKALRASSFIAWQTPVTRGRITPKATLTVLVFGSATAAVAAGGAALRHRGAPLSLLALLVGVVVWAAVWWLASLLLPHGQAGAFHLLPGALLFGVGMQVLYIATVVYFSRKIASASELYGALGAGATVLLWLFLFARLLIAAAVLNAVLWERGTVRHLIERLERLVRT
jgi:uncharacterized BrkB/YihY/UPF0761 family membrane protein